MMDGAAKSEAERVREPAEWVILKMSPEEPDIASEPKMSSLKPLEAKKIQKEREMSSPEEN